ncbi:MAG: dihydropteroate synthase [Candidatus Micrarchaeota archaeon]
MSTRIMSILNVTPDSFFDGGRYSQLQKAVERAVLMESEGADYIDVGGESTRPGSEPVSAEEEAKRVIPVIKSLAKEVSIPISIDSYKFETIEKAVDAGASFVNDITGLKDERIRRIVAENDLEACIMHMLGTPKTMQQKPNYTDVVKEVGEFLKERRDVALEEGIKKNKLYLDPGIGFGKTTEQNWKLLNSLKEFKKIGKVLIGASRKSFIGKFFGSEEKPLPVEERLQGSLEIAKLCIKQNVDILRVHDTRETRLFSNCVKV